ncbi:MAG: tetraacyldisaccharide 4'-kinase [Bacteroidota bacterium]|nr:tetraacyldisaccharide 4'-kinase [Bacteroidota bacterium]MDP4217732.1 tetraacyldisaccharide 4'-kinase [Bacteroidota bacterium]MDP4247652.1 tetraacyldisaccharide 4'-kinase [Bacteroidota bacterium]MDP4253717.1 tetraacyldisaccharide 4'-kinase [Bacteroidota bacterium]MDP4259663.1 tetraacyldisaccharide 4'-kinase [Bacteroidota bacterium]
MNLNFPLLRPIRMLLFPLSLPYALIILMRNWCYDRKILSSSEFNLPIIGVGNLAVGGTGKSPMVEWLIRELKDEFEIAVLSRGYKRKTTGYAMAGPDTTALEIGDEPMLFHTKFPDVSVAVGEERMVAIPQLLHDRPSTRVIIMDDAFQHRSVRAGLNILLTDCSNLFTRDWWLPSGDLRDAPRSARRADLIVVTKCPDDLDTEQREQITREIAPEPHQQVFFSAIQYGTPYHITKKNPGRVDDKVEVLLITGIANPAPLKRWLNEKSRTYYELSYSDHHIFSIDDLNTMIRRFNAIPARNKIILTTEKDAVRLTKFAQELESWPFYVIPIEPRFLFDGQQRFKDLIVKFITGFRS